MSSNNYLTRLIDIINADRDDASLIEAISALGINGSMVSDYVPFLLQLVTRPRYYRNQELLSTIASAINEIGIDSYVAHSSFVQLLNRSNPQEVILFALHTLIFNTTNDYDDHITLEVIMAIIDLFDDHRSLGKHLNRIYDISWWAFCILDRWHSVIMPRCFELEEQGYSHWKSLVSQSKRSSQYLGVVGLSYFGEESVTALLSLLGEETDSLFREVIIKSCYWLGQSALPIVELGLLDNDECVRQLATYIRDRLESRLPLFISWDTSSKKR